MLQLINISLTIRLDLGLRLLLWDNKWQCSIAINDALRTLMYNVTATTSDIMQNRNDYLDSKQFTFSLKYIFGNNTISAKERKLGNQEEINRTN